MSARNPATPLLLIQQYALFCQTHHLRTGAFSDERVAPLIAQFRSFTLEQILPEVRRVERWSVDTLAFVSVIVDKCVTSNRFEFANTLLEVAYSDCANCRKAQLTIINKGLDMAGACIKVRQFGVADDCLRRAFYFFPNGSEEQWEVARRGFNIIDACSAWDDYGFATSLLQRCAGLFSNCSIEDLQTKESIKRVLENRAWLKLGWTRNQSYK